MSGLKYPRRSYLDSVGSVESLWRYPVKSMRGEQLSEALLHFGGVQGDRAYAIHDRKAQLDFPYFTARQRSDMLLCRPAYRSGAEVGCDVQLPNGQNLAIEDPALLEYLDENSSGRHELSLLHSEHALSDCSPVSVLSVQTVQLLAQELGNQIDKLAFRANMYLDLHEAEAFSEDKLVGRRVRIGETVILAVVERDVRCKMITLDPATGKADPEIMKLVAGQHESRVGVYADVLVEGVVRPGDLVTVID